MHFFQILNMYDNSMYFILWQNNINNLIMKNIFMGIISIPNILFREKNMINFIPIKYSIFYYIIVHVFCCFIVLVYPSTYRRQNILCKTSVGQTFHVTPQASSAVQSFNNMESSREKEHLLALKGKRFAVKCRQFLPKICTECEKLNFPLCASNRSEIDGMPLICSRLNPPLLSVWQASRCVCYSVRATVNRTTPPNVNLCICMQYQTGHDKCFQSRSISLHLCFICITQHPLPSIFVFIFTT